MGGCILHRSVKVVSGFPLSALGYFVCTRSIVRFVMFWGRGGSGLWVSCGLVVRSPGGFFPFLVVRVHAVGGGLLFVRVDVDTAYSR